MSKIGIFMADGCEEIEGLTVVDIVRRAKMDITMISVNGKREVTSSHGVTFLTDAVAEEVDYDALDGIVLPGGMPGTLHLLDHAAVNEVIKKFAGEGKLVAAICAARATARICASFTAAARASSPSSRMRRTRSSAIWSF